MSEEIWKPVVGYEGLYEVSNTGRVRSLDRYDRMNRFWKGRILNLHTDTGGYLYAQLYLNGKGKNYLVHRMVAQAFIPNPDNLPQVNHKDENKINDCVENLEWCSREYNINYGTIKDRIRNTAIKNGYWSGLSKKEYFKKYWNEHREYISEYQKEYYMEHREKRSEQQREYSKNYYYKNREKICERLKENRRKKKEENIQNNVKSLNDQI